tara:strand:- start:494 stop:1105 length:612 start_codon:yes stop_codon:yes gene_type:complete
MSGNFIDPVNGNQSFGNVNRMAAGVGNLVVHNQIKANSIDGQLPEFTVVGYTPTNFSTANATINDIVWSLNSSPNQPGNLTNALQVPQGVVPIKVVIEAVNPIVGTNGGTLNLGLSPNRGIGDNQNNTLDLLATVDYNNLRLNEQGRRVAALYGGTPAGAIGSTGIMGEPLDQFINITLNSAATPILTSGSLKVRVTFIQLNY